MSSGTDAYFPVVQSKVVMMVVMVMVLLLSQVSGERSQEEVFRDVQRAHAKIIRPQPHPPPSRASVGRYNNHDDYYTGSLWTLLQQP